LLTVERLGLQEKIQILDLSEVGITTSDKFSIRRLSRDPLGCVIVGVGVLLFFRSSSSRAGVCAMLRPIPDKVTCLALVSALTRVARPVHAACAACAVHAACAARLIHTARPVRAARLIHAARLIYCCSSHRSTSHGGALCIVTLCIAMLHIFDL
jgi:hypothetical protein